jgi:hypothetical protein
VNGYELFLQFRSIFLAPVGQAEFLRMA